MNQRNCLCGFTTNPKTLYGLL